MLLYVIIALFLVMLIVFDDVSKGKRKNITKVLYAIAIFVLCFLSSIRSVDVGADTNIYVQYFETIRDSTIGESFAEMSFLEPGYILLNKVASFFCDNPNIIIVVNSLLLFVSLSLFLKKGSKDRLLSVFLFVSLGFFQSSLNITRSCIAVFMGYAALETTKKNKIISIALFVFGFLMHKSILLLLLVPLLEKVPLKKKYIKYYLLSAVGLFFALDYLMPILDSFLLGGYDYYVQKSTEGVVEKSLSLIVHLFLFIFVTCRIGDKSFMKNNKRFYIFMFLELIFYLFSIKYSMFTRVAYIFSMYIIVTIPNAINENLPKMRMRMKYLVILFCLAQYITRMSINNIGKTIPYDSVLMKE